MSSTPAVVKETFAEMFWKFPLFVLIREIPCGILVWFWEDPLFEETFPWNIDMWWRCLHLKQVTLELQSAAQWPDLRQTKHFALFLKTALRAWGVSNYAALITWMVISTIRTTNLPFSGVRGCPCKKCWSSVCFILLITLIPSFWICTR